MDRVTYGVVACALVGLVGCFLPLGPGGITFWHLRGGSPAESYAIMAGYAVALVVPALAIAKPPLVRWQAIVASAAFAFVLIQMRELLASFVVDGRIGGKLMALAPAVGLVLAIVCVARPARVTS